MLKKDKVFTALTVLAVSAAAAGPAFAKGGTGTFAASTNPQSITVESSLGGSSTRTVTAK